MKLVELHLGGFGRFSDFDLAFSPVFTVVVGPNEAGKTTLAEGILGVLFGFRRGLKHLRDRYRPRAGGASYTASLLLVTEDDRRYLLGRDFEHDRLEIFAGEGVRLAPLPETELPTVLRTTLGVDAPLVFESTLFLRRPGAGPFRRERMLALALAEVLGLMPEPTATESEKTPPAPRSSPPGPEAADHEPLDPLMALRREKERLAGLLASLLEEERVLAKKRAALEALWIAQEERKKLEKQLEEIRQRLAEASAKDEGKEGPAGPEEANLARAEELAAQIALLEVELRYEEEALRDHEAEIELLEREISLTRAKLEGLAPYLLNPEIQAQVTRILPLINQHMARLGELFPMADRLAGRLRRLRRSFFILLGLGFAAAGVSLGFYGLLSKPYSFLLPGLGVLSWCGAFSLLIRATRLRTTGRRLTTEIEKREEELAARRSEVENLLQGKTIAQYQSELEAKKLYENDLWQLEQTLAQKKAGKDSRGRMEEIKTTLEKAKKELAALLAAGGWTDLADMRARTAQTAAGAEPPPSLAPELLRSQEEDLVRRLAALPTARFDPAELAALEEAQARLRAQYEETRLRLAEIETAMAEGAKERERGEERPPVVPSSGPVPPADGASVPPELAGRMGEILAEVTGGRYREVRLTVDSEGLRVGVVDPATGELLSVPDLSSGSLAQLRLAMEVALAEKLAGHRHPPFLLDDPFAELDADRLSLTAGFLARLCRDRQIVWCPRQKEVIRMLEENGITPETIFLRAGEGRTEAENG
ncbi:MAG: AAA family ATPase [Firmicutes bacterium]|nr:AAA family ATPase [Bacillota bacterium]